MRCVALASANRAERGILLPIIRRLERRADIEFLLAEPPWHALDPLGSHLLSSKKKNGLSFEPDVLLIPADRREMAELAMECYYRGFAIFHLWAGIAPTGTWDDVNRRVISSFSYLLLVESEECRQRLIASGEEPWRVHVVGTPHFDDLQIDESLCPSQPYDLVLLNPNPVDPDDDRKSMKKALDLLHSSRPVVWIGPNEGELRIPVGLMFSYLKTYKTLPRPQFLGLMKNCDRYISNSSSVAYEAPFLRVKTIINPSSRNATRKFTGELKSGAADKIVELLCTFPLEKEKMLKVYR